MLWEGDKIEPRAEWKSRKPVFLLKEVAEFYPRTQDELVFCRYRIEGLFVRARRAVGEHSEVDNDGSGI